MWGIFNVTSALQTTLRLNICLNLGLNKNKMKKENIYVQVKHKKQAKLFKGLLKKMNEPISPDYWIDDWDKDQNQLGFNQSGYWAVGCGFEGVKITFGQLIDLLNEPKKIAVKVENEKEFKALMKYYDSIGYKCQTGERSTDLEFSDGWNEWSISFEDDFGRVNWIHDKEYEKVPFSDFAKEHGIKLPLITSEDGVDLYAGDQFYTYFCDEGREYGPHVLQDASSVLLDPKNRKAFSTKQAALEWIAAQKPEEIKVKLFDECVYALVSKKEILFKWKNGATHSTYRIAPSDIEEISKAIKDLQK